MQEDLAFLYFIQPFFYNLRNKSIVSLFRDIFNNISYSLNLWVFLLFRGTSKCIFKTIHKYTLIWSNGRTRELPDNACTLIGHINTTTFFFQKHDVIPQMKRFSILNFLFAFINKPCYNSWMTQNSPLDRTPPSTNYLRKLLSTYESRQFIAWSIKY